MAAQEPGPTLLPVWPGTRSSIVKATLEVGRWYAYQGDPESLRGRPVQVLRFDDDAVLGKWANGMDYTDIE
jgi:hypothetical protein